MVNSIPSSTICDVVRNLASRQDNRVFLRLLSLSGAAENYTYTEVVNRARRWSRFYATKGLGPGARVVVILQHSLDLYAAYLGALLGGHVPAMFAFPSVKLAVGDYGKTIGKLLDNTEASLVITYPELQRQISSILRNEQAALLCVDARLPLAGDDEFLSNPSPDAVAFIQYSSGTTGLKKGVAITHRALLWQVDAYRRAIQLDHRDSIVSWLPLYHDMGLICCFFLPLLTGTPLTAMSAFDWVKRPNMLLAAITKYRGTLCWLPNFAYNFLVQSVTAADVGVLDLSSLRGVVNCSEPLMAESHQRFIDYFAPAKFRPEALAASYAMAETTFAITSGGFAQPLKTDVIESRIFTTESRAQNIPAGSSGARTLVSSGCLLVDTLVEILAEDGTVVNERCIGEIAVRSPGLFEGYHMNQDATAGNLRDGWFHTGDLGYIADGHLFVTGRKKDLIIIAGKNIYPQDIEDAVNQVPGVIPGRAVAFGVADPSHGTERLVVVAEAGHLNDELREFLTKAIFAVVAAQTDLTPGDVRFVEHRWLAKSSSGKLSRGANRQRYLEMIAAEANDVVSAPAIPVAGSTPADGPVSFEAVMACLGRVLLKKGKTAPMPLTLDTHLIRTGLIDSLSLVALVMELEAAFDFTIPAEVLEARNFETVRTVGNLLQRIKSPGAATVAPIVNPPVMPTNADSFSEGHDAPGYDAYVSLGFNCEAGLQFHRHGILESSFFQFTFTSIDATLALIRNDFEGVFLKTNLVPHWDTMVRDTRYDVVFHSNLHSIIDPAEGHRVFRTDYDFDQVYRLYYALTIQHLIRKWRTLTSSSDRVLYVLKLEPGKGRDRAEELHREMTARYPNHAFTLLCLQPEALREPDWQVPGLVNRYLPRFAPIENAHDADSAAWDCLFTEFPLRRARNHAGTPCRQAASSPEFVSV